MKNVCNFWRQFSRPFFYFRGPIPHDGMATSRHNITSRTCVNRTWVHTHALWQFTQTRVAWRFINLLYCKSINKRRTPWRSPRASSCRIFSPLRRRNGDCTERGGWRGSPRELHPCQSRERRIFAFSWVEGWWARWSLAGEEGTYRFVVYLQ